MVIIEILTGILAAILALPVLVFFVQAGLAWLPLQLAGLDLALFGAAVLLAWQGVRLSASPTIAGRPCR